MAAPWRTAKIIRIEDASPNTRRFWFEIQDVSNFDFTPGQFVTLDLPIHERPNKRWRSYSIASHPNGTNLLELVIVLVEGGAGTTYLFNEAKVGTEVPCRGPQGVFVLPEKIEKDLFFVCTGTGIAPFRSMIHYIHENKIQHKNIYLIYGCRYLHDGLYADEMKQLEQQMEGFHYIPTFSREPQTNTEIKHGYVHDVYNEIVTAGNKPDAQFYLCGWKNMVTDARKNIQDLGYVKTDIHFELYG